MEQRRKEENRRKERPKKQKVKKIEGDKIGAFLVTTKNAAVPINRVFSVNTFTNFNCPTRE